MRLLGGISNIAVAAILAASSGASAAVLSNGAGDGTVTVDVSAFGAFAGAIYDPVGDIEPATTTFASFVALPNVSGRSRLDDFPVDVSVLSDTGTEYVTTFTINFLEFTLTQTLVDSVQDGQLVGASLLQQFAIKNIADVPNRFDLVRYMDGDLDFDDTLADSGGIVSAGGSDILFETDGAGGTDATTTFLGITTSVTGMTNAVAERNYEIDSYSGLESRIFGGFTLYNTIAGDDDGDGFIDGAYDVTLAFQNFLSLNAGQSVTYTTATLFGNAVPPAPGSSEVLPLLPTGLGPDGGFEFVVDAALFGNGATVWIDPVIATGYTYTVTGAEFASVTAPSLAVVNDTDGYVVTVAGLDFTLAAGETFSFGDDVTSFTITDIATGLSLDPADFTAFATGISLRDITASTVIINQTPITTDTDTGGGTPSPVPLPAGVWLLGAGLAGLRLLRRPAMIA